MINHVVNFSGGRTSAYMVHLFETRKQTEDINVEYIFQDTGAEHPATYKFIRDIVDHWGIELTCLRVDINPEMGKGNGYKIISLDDCQQDLLPFLDMAEKYGTPYQQGAFCTQFMKTRPCEKYCSEKYGKDGYTKWLGMRIDEPSRIKKTKYQFDLFTEVRKIDTGLKNVKYLADISSYEKQDILDWWSHQDFDLEIEGDVLGNCVFCIKRGANKLALAARKEPGMAKNFIAMVNLDSIPTPESRTLPNDIMYRGDMSLETIIDAYKDVSEQDIMRTMRGFKDPGGCGESCEATFSTDNFDLFEGI